MASSGKGKRTALRALAAIAGAAIVVGGFEIGLRLHYRRTKKEREHGWHEYDETLGWRNKRGVPVRADPEDDKTLARAFDIRLNGQGMRQDGEISPEPSAGVTRIAFLGDSYTFGYCVEGEAAFPALMGAALGPRFEAANFGVSGYGLDQSLLQLERDVLPKKPSLVVFSVEDVNFRRATGATFEGVPKPYFELSGSGLELANVPVPRIEMGETYYKTEARGSFVAWWAARAWKQAAARLSKDPEAASERWLLGRAILARAARKTRESGARLVVALLPEQQLIGRDPLARLLPALAQEEGFPLLDLYPAFQERMAKESTALFVPGDGHPSEAGHRLIADELRAFLEKRGLVAR